MSRTGREFLIEGHTLGYPTRFPHGTSMMAAFVVPVGAAEAVLAHTPFRPARLLPRRAVISLNCVHYENTDAGTYDEVACAVLVDDPESAASAAAPILRWRSVLDGSIGAFSWMLGVSTTLSRDCGRQMWGFPKSLGDVQFRRRGDVAEMIWSQDGSLVLRYRALAVGRRTPAEISPRVYSMFEGGPHVGRLTQRYEGVGYHVRGARLELGTHSHADALRQMGLSTRPLVSVWNERLSFEMSEPVPVAVRG